MPLTTLLAHSRAWAWLLRGRGRRAALSLLSPLLYFFDELRGDVKQVAYNAEVGDLKQGRVLIVVDHNDLLRSLHAGFVLDGTGHTEADVQVRRDCHAGLPDLELSGVVAGVHNVAGDTDGTAEDVGKRFHDVRETFSGSDAAAASDDHFGLGEVGAVAAFGGRKSSDHGFCRVGVRQFQRNEFTCSSFGGSINRAGAQGVDGTVAAGGCGDGNSVAKDGHGGGARRRSHQPRRRAHPRRGGRRGDLRFHSQ